MKKIFLDIGAHVGETLDIVRGSKYDFDRIYAFEPSPKCLHDLNKYSELDSRIRILPFGLGDLDESRLLYGSGSLAASTLSTEGIPSLAASAINQDKVEIRRASSWIRSNLDPEDLIIGKLNCEGGEVAILEDLLESGIISYFYSLMITFDIRCFPRQSGIEGDLRSRLRKTGLTNFCFSDDVIIGPTHERRISHWLDLFGLSSPKLANVNQYRSDYAGLLQKYSQKRGLFPRIESYLKHSLSYDLFPDSIKALLRGTKALLRLNKEREPG